MLPGQIFTEMWNGKIITVEKVGMSANNRFRPFIGDRRSLAMVMQIEKSGFYNDVLIKYFAVTWTELKF